MYNNWHNIWNKRTEKFDSLDKQNASEVFMEMIRIDGGDITDRVSYDAYISNYQKMKETMNARGGDSLFEVGCGCGPYLYLLHNDGFKIGGIDYSPTLLKHMKKVLPDSALLELVSDEAINMPTLKQYDIVFSRGVFHYFPDYDYANEVMGKMLDKTKKTLGFFMIHDKEKESDFINGRKKIDPDYEDKYKDLPKLFYTKEFFQSFAAKHNLSAKFLQIPLEGFWNDAYTFDCIMYK